MLLHYFVIFLSLLFLNSLGKNLSVECSQIFDGRITNSPTPKSYAETMAALQRMSRSPRRYLTSTASAIASPRSCRKA